MKFKDHLKESVEFERMNGGRIDGHDAGAKGYITKAAASYAKLANIATSIYHRMVTRLM